MANESVYSVDVCSMLQVPFLRVVLYCVYGTSSIFVLVNQRWKGNVVSRMPSAFTYSNMSSFLFDPELVWESRLVYKKYPCLEGELNL